MLRVVLDWESAYGKHPVTGENITLSKMTTEEYVRHPLFKVHGLGVKIDQDAAFYLYKRDDLVHFLKTHPWSKTFAIAHHAHFDGAIMTWRCGIRPALWGCTLSMARALFPHESSSLANISRLLGTGEKGHELVTVKDKWELTEEEQRVIGGYCATNRDSDINLTARAFDAMKRHFPVSEMRLIDLTVRLFTEPVLQVERGVLVEEYKRERRSKRALLKECATDKAVLASGDQFAALLLSLGVDPPKKLSPSKVKDGRVDPALAGDPPLGLLPSFKARGTVEERVLLKAEKDTYPWSYAFGKSDEVFKLLQDHPDLHIQALVEARLGIKSTLKETRSKRFFKIGTRGAFPVYHNYYGARTGRDSGGDRQNTTNLNRVDPKDPTSGALRKSLLAPEGHVLVVRDLGQIEARVLAYAAGQEDLLDLFRAGGDPYNRQASLIFGYEVDRKKDQFWLEGLAGKASTLGNGYGMGWSKFQESLRVGFMGMPPVLFDQAAAVKLGADIDAFGFARSYKKGCANLRDEAMSMKPLNVEESAHLWHCAAVKVIVDKYRESNAAIVAFWREAGQALRIIEQGEEVVIGRRNLVSTCAEGFLLPNGMKIRYNKLKGNENGEYRYLSNARKKEWSYIYGGKCVENVIQALARIVLTDQMLAIHRWLAARKKADPSRFYQVVTSTYDEVVCCVPEELAETCLSMMKTEMATAPPWCADLPLKSSGGYAKNYGDCEK
jgi:DNA polymerase